MSNIYHIAVIDGKLTYEGDADKYGIGGSGTATNLGQLCKVYNFGPNGYCFQNIYNQYPIFKIPIQKSKPMSFGCYVMEKGTSNNNISNTYVLPLVANAEGYGEFGVQLSDLASRGRIGARVRSTTYTISDGRPSYYNTWYQLVLTKDEKDIWRFFVDGNLIGSVTNDVSLGTLDLWVNMYDVNDTNTYIQDAFAVDYCIADKNFTWEIKKNLPNYTTESQMFPKLYQY